MKGKWSFFTIYHHKTYFSSVSQNELQRSRTERNVLPNLHKQTINSLFWSLDNRGPMQCEEAEGFALLHCSTYVTSVLQSCNPTNAQKCKSENIICFTLVMYCQRVAMSLLHFLLVWVVFFNAFSHKRTNNCCARKDPLVQHACPLEGYPFTTSVSLHTASSPSIARFPYWKICLKLFFMPFALMVLFSKLFHMLPIRFQAKYFFLKIQITVPFQLVNDTLSCLRFSFSLTFKHSQR